MWNVNVGRLSLPLPVFSVLIETLWNVNENRELIFSTLFSFNRNIVECKCRTAEEGIVPEARFNRNIVECKFTIDAECEPYRLVLIETLWNVNEHLLLLLFCLLPVLIETLWNVNAEWAE